MLPSEHLLPVQHLWLGLSSALRVALHGSIVLARACSCCLLMRRQFSLVLRPVLGTLAVSLVGMGGMFCKVLRLCSPP